jgi:hypothetical protein
MALSASSATLPAPSINTTLPGEIVTTTGGLGRRICAFAHTASTNYYSLTGVFTANSNDSLPVTVGSIGIFSSMVVGATPSMLLNTNFTSEIAILNSGDQLPVTDIVSGT